MGYLRARRSIRLGPGVKLNLNKRSVGVTVGGRGAHYSVNTRGQRTGTVGIPGTGLSYVERSTTHGSSSHSPARSSYARAQEVGPTAPPAHPSLLARHYERAFYDGVQKFAAGETDAALAAFTDADQSDDRHRAISPALFVGILTSQIGDAAKAVPYLERVITSAQHLPDTLMTKYANGFVISIEIGRRVTVPIQIGSVAASMVLAECYRDTGRVHEAIGLMQQLHDQGQAPSMLLVLCTMYREAEDWDEIVHATAGISNDDDLTLLLRLLQAEAMERQNLPDAALESYRDALKSKKRDPELLKQARYGRATLYLRTGKRSMAKRDLGRLYGEDPDYEDVSVLLRDLA